MKETKLQRDIRLLRAQVARLEMQRNGALAALVNAETKLPGLRKNLERLKLRLFARERSICNCDESTGCKGLSDKVCRSKLRNLPVADAGVAQDPSPVPVTHVAEDRRPAVNATAGIEAQTSNEPLAGQLDEIPTFLRRTALQPEVATAAHAVANKHNKIPTEDQKKLVASEKRKVKEEHKHAELTGAKRKAPLSGREAEAFLRGR